MITGEYKGASLGTLAAGLTVAVGLVVGLGGGDDAPQFSQAEQSKLFPWLS